MRRQREQELARLVQSHKANLLDKLAYTGFKSFDQWELKVNEYHPADYESYLKAINIFWQEAYVAGIHSRLAKVWYSKYGKQLGVDLMSADLEASYLLRYAIRGFKPNQSKLETYARPVVFRGLRTWSANLLSPVDLPDKLARRGPVGYTSIEDDDD